MDLDLRDWSKSEVEYGRKILDSGLAGARSGREAFLNGTLITPFLSDAARNALMPTTVGVLLGFLGSYPGSQRRSTGRALGFALLGGLVGLGAGIAWQSRSLTACVAESAWKSIGRVRDEHWLERNPIDYA